MGSLQDELRRAGLVTEKQVQRQQIQEQRRVRRHSSRNQFSSVRDFLASVGSRLSASNCNTKEIFTDAFWLGDDLPLNRGQRSRLYKFLYMLVENTRGMDMQERVHYLAEKIRKY